MSKLGRDLGREKKYSLFCGKLIIKNIVIMSFAEQKLFLPEVILSLVLLLRV